MSGYNSSDSSTSESETSAYSTDFNPLKALYSKKTIIPVKDAPLYENIQQFEAAQQNVQIIPVGHSNLVLKREEEKERLKKEKERELEEKNRQRFAKYQGLVPTKKNKPGKNVLNRITTMLGPLRALKDCVDQRLRIKVTTRNDKGIRGVLHATLVAFDKQWNLALTDVLEVWTRKGPRKRKVPPGMGTPVPKGTAAAMCAVPEVTETPLGGGMYECTRHVPQLMIRGEHVVIVNVVERTPPIQAYRIGCTGVS